MEELGLTPSSDATRPDVTDRLAADRGMAECGTRPGTSLGSCLVACHVVRHATAPAASDHFPLFAELEESADEPS